MKRVSAVDRRSLICVGMKVMRSWPTGEIKRIAWFDPVKENYGT